MPAREGYVSVPGGRVWYQVEGEASGIPLLTLHGGPGFPHDYLEPLSGLSDERPVVFYDQLGCGKSDRPSDPSLWQVDRFLEELKQLIAALDLEQVHIVGHSWGSTLATAYAITQPRELVSLILAGPFISVPRYLEDNARHRKGLPQELCETLERHEAAGTIDSEEYQDAILEYYRRHVCRVYPWPEPFQRTIDHAGLEVYNTMWGPNEFYATGNLLGYDLSSRLPEIKAPVLYTCGRYDSTTPEAAAWFQSLTPGAELAIFENSAHMVMVEEPEPYLQVVRDFLRRVEAKA